MPCAWSRELVCSTLNGSTEYDAPRLLARFVARPQGHRCCLLGKSGFSVVDTLAELGVETAVVGKTAKPELVDLVGLIGSKFLASESPEVLSELGFQPDFAVVSPGFSPIIR